VIHHYVSEGRICPAPRIRPMQEIP
jgi:hypothetical protein